MVRTTRTSAAVKNSTLASGGSSSASSTDSDKGEAPPPEDSGNVAGTDEMSAGAVEEAALSPKMRASVVLEKLPMEQISPSGPSAGSGSARKGARGRKVSMSFMFPGKMVFTGLPSPCEF